MLIINSQNNNNNKIWKCRPPLFELLLIIRHKSAEPTFHVRYPNLQMPQPKNRPQPKCDAHVLVCEFPLWKPKNIPQSEYQVEA